MKRKRKKELGKIMYSQFEIDVNVSHSIVGIELRWEKSSFVDTGKITTNSKFESFELWANL